MAMEPVGFPHLDSDGFLADTTSWNPGIASELAKLEGITLTTAHWEIIQALRDFYECYELSPAMRALIKFLRTSLPYRANDIANSQYLMTLFGGTPARTAARLAGLPKPANCL